MRKHWQIQLIRLIGGLTLVNSQASQSTFATGSYAMDDRFWEFGGMCKSNDNLQINSQGLAEYHSTNYKQSSRPFLK